jgi:transcriptional regulator with XRE-family HTH domain
VVQVAAQLRYKLRITQIDVADLAGVAKGTVSYALNGNDIIKAATRRRCLRQPRRWLPPEHHGANKTNRAASSVIPGTSTMIPADEQPADDSSIGRWRQAERYHLLTFIQPQEDAMSSDELISTNRVDGFILSDIRYDDSRIQRLFALDAPFVAFGECICRMQHLLCRCRWQRGIEIVMDHLLSLVTSASGRLIGIPASCWGCPQRRLSCRHAGCRNPCRTRLDRLHTQHFEFRIPGHSAVDGRSPSAFGYRVHQ